MDSCSKMMASLHDRGILADYDSTCDAIVEVFQYYAPSRSPNADRVKFPPDLTRSAQLSERVLQQLTPELKEKLEQKRVEAILLHLIDYCHHFNLRLDEEVIGQMADNIVDNLIEVATQHPFEVGEPFWSACDRRLNSLATPDIAANLLSEELAPPSYPITRDQAEKMGGQIAEHLLFAENSFVYTLPAHLSKVWGEQTTQGLV